MALVEVLDEHEDALQADLLQRGLRLRWLWDPDDDRLTLDDAWVVVRTALRDPYSALMQSMHPDRYEWGLPEQLMALFVDRLSIVSWQLGSGEERDFPQPLPRPGVETPQEENLLFNNGQHNLDPETIVDPREWLYDEDPLWREFMSRAKPAAPTLP